MGKEVYLFKDTIQILENHMLEHNCKNYNEVIRDMDFIIKEKTT